MFEERYRKIIDAVDAEFARNRELYGDRIRCRAGCTDCCSHVFAIGEFEAARIREAVNRLEPALRNAIEQRAREYVGEYLLRGTRQPCPALDESGKCSIYESRPLLCRKFGMPIFNPDKPARILACALNFGEGEELADPQLIQIQTAIHREWSQLQEEYEQSRGGARVPRLTVAQAILSAGLDQPA